MNILIKRMQIRKQPVQHRFARWIKQALRTVEAQFCRVGGVAPAFTAAYRKWQSKMREVIIGKGALVVEVDKIMIAFATMIVKSTRARLAPYIAFYEAAELIDPTSSLQLDDTVWAAVRLLCERHDLDYDSTKDAIVCFRATVPFQLNPQQVRACKENLLNVYHGGSFADEGTKGVRAFASVVFTLPLTNALVE